MGHGDKFKKQSWRNDPALLSPIPDPRVDNCHVFIMSMNQLEDSSP